MSYDFTGGYKIRDQHAWHFLTFTVVGWTDLFSRKVYRDELIKNMVHCRQEKQLSIGAYVIMTNHIHVIWHSACGRLSDTVRDFKSYCTKRFIEIIQSGNESRRDGLLHTFGFYARQTAQNKDYKIWTSDNHPEEIHSEAFLRTKLNYTHENPVRAGWVQRPEDWLYSSASNYLTGTGLMEIDFLF